MERIFNPPVLACHGFELFEISEGHDEIAGFHADMSLALYRSLDT